MLIFTFFDRIQGPIVFLTSPRNLIDKLKKEHINQVISLLDTFETDAFFTHYFSSELKTANYVFSLGSKWARGRIETCMISVIISEKEPDFSKYEITLSKFVDKLKKEPEIYKAFYIDFGSADVIEKEDILENFNILKEDLDNLFKILTVKRIETEGQLLSLSKLKNDGVIKLSKSSITKISQLTEEKKNCFLVFRRRGEAMKLDIIPVESKKIFNLEIIFGEQMNVTVLQQISQIFNKYDESMSLIFSSGICQEVDKCIYEVYIDTEMGILNQIIKDLYEISNIIEMEVKLIELET